MNWSHFKSKKGGDGDGDGGVEETKDGDATGKDASDKAKQTAYKFGKGEGDEGVDW